MNNTISSTKKFSVKLENVYSAAERISGVVLKSPLAVSFTHSKNYRANILLKREDLQQVRSYKIRGAYNKISGLNKEQLDKGVICASAGNHAQGVAFSCNKLKVKGEIFMPGTTPKQKVEQTKMFGGEWVKIILEGDTFDDSFKSAMLRGSKSEMIFIHPFDDLNVIEGQATIALEILEQSEEPIDYIFAPLGGGGLLVGISSVFKELSPSTKIIEVEPEGAPSMSASLHQNELTELPHIDRFVDGAAVQKVGSLNFEICRKNLDDMVTVPEGKICQTILNFYNQDAIVVEPAGALSIAALDFYKDEIVGKNVVCIVSGSNSDITRMAEIKERALLYGGLKHYFIVPFPQRAGALKKFVAEVLGPTDDITHFEYSKKHHRENGPAVVGIELKDPKDFEPLVERMKKHNFYGQYLNDKPDLFQFLV